ncbi:NAD(P)H-dependent oxidoreductase [Francisellaceae bacterium]|nr:NAD(P)H-dependent oxidoreductase [Francisellaceae bacterium]
MACSSSSLYGTSYTIGLVPADKKFLESPLHDGRKVMFSITTGSTIDEYSVDDCNIPIEGVFTPMNTVYRFIGYEIIKPFVFYSARSKTEVELKKVFEKHKQYFA